LSQDPDVVACARPSDAGVRSDVKEIADSADGILKLLRQFACRRKDQCLALFLFKVDLLQECDNASRRLPHTGRSMNDRVVARKHGQDARNSAQNTAEIYELSEQKRGEHNGGDTPMLGRSYAPSLRSRCVNSLHCLPPRRGYWLCGGNERALLNIIRLLKTVRIDAAQQIVLQTQILERWHDLQHTQTRMHNHPNAT
jgi:hypothetical protein